MADKRDLAYQQNTEANRLASEDWIISFCDILSVDMFDYVWVLDYSSFKRSDCNFFASTIGSDGPVSISRLETYPILGKGYVIKDHGLYGAVVAWKPNK